MKINESASIKKNILFFFSTTKIGGTETNFLGLSKDLRDLGYNIFVLAAENDGPLFNKFESFATDIGIIKLKRFNQLSNVILYRDFILRNKIEIVLNCGLKVEIFSRLFSHLFKVEKVISNIRSTDDWRKFYHTFLDRITQFGVDLWVSNSKAGIDAFSRREGIDLNRAHVIYNYVNEFNDTDLSAYVTDKLSNVNIGILANLKSGKGFEDLTEVTKELYRLGEENFYFLIGGIDYSNGRIPRELKKSIYSKHFKFLGFIDDKQEFFNKIDIFFLPTYWEGFPTSVLEAMSFGKPIISTTVGGIPEMIENNYNGFISEPGKAKQFARNIQQLSCSSDLYNHFRNNSFKILRERFTRLTELNKWIEVLK